MIRNRAGKAQLSSFYSPLPQPRWLPHCPCQDGWNDHEPGFSFEERCRPARKALTPSPHQQTFRIGWKQGRVRTWQKRMTFWQECLNPRRNMLLEGLPGRHWWGSGVASGRSGGSCCLEWRAARKPLGGQRLKALRGTSDQTCWKVI